MKTRINDIPSNDSHRGGFTIVEVLLALIVFTVGILALNAMQITSVKGNSTANQVTLATTWNSDLLENILSVEYDDELLEDTDSDGTDQDLQPIGLHDGVDDNGGNFGLDDINAAADHSELSPDGLYTIFWNVAVDHPIPKVKTIKAIVIRNSDRTRMAIFETCKSSR